MNTSVIDHEYLKHILMMNDWLIVKSMMHNDVNLEFTWSRFNHTRYEMNIFSDVDTNSNLFLQ